MLVNKDDPVTWPRESRFAIEYIARVLRLALVTARDRIYNMGLTAETWFLERNRLLQKIKDQDRELQIHRSRIEHLNPRRRPHYKPYEWRAILDLMYRRNWPAKVVAKRFVVSVSAVNKWQRKLKGPEPWTHFDLPAHNRYGDAGRWIVHEIAAIFPEPECGYRTIANMIRKCGIAMSKSTVQRILKEQKPKQPTPPSAKPDDSETVKPFRVLRPKAINYTWHLDFSTVRVFFWTFKVAAILDGYSRKLLAPRVYRKEPSNIEMVSLVQQAVVRFGKPRFLVTDHGSQFRRTFRKLTRDCIGTHVKGKVRSCTFNGKVERFFKTMKLWSRLSLLTASVVRAQQHLDLYRSWYNEARCHQGIGGLTPEEVWSRKTRPVPIRIFTRDTVQPAVAVARDAYHGDEHLPMLRMQLLRPARRVA